MHRDPERAFWEGNARTANVLTASVITVDGIYFLATWSTGGHRPLLLGITLAALVGQLFSALSGTEARMLESDRRDLFFGTWAAMGLAVALLAVLLDGGVESPLVWLFPLGTMFCALLHPPRLVLAQGAGAVVGYGVVAVVDDGLDRRPAAVALQLAYLVVVTALSAQGAASRWAYHRSQAELSERDALTGLANHRVFHERLQLELDTAARTGETVAVVLVDLDLFKDVNDRHGHLVGDEALRVVAKTLQAASRSADVVARVGGEEFGVVLRGTDGQGAVTFAERARQGIEDITHPVPLTVSIGVSCSQGGAATPDTLFDAADKAMYRAKRAGRNRVCSAA